MDSCHGIDLSLVMGSSGLLSWDRVESCHGIDWSLVMGSIGVLSWDQLDFCHGLLGGGASRAGAAASKTIHEGVRARLELCP